MKWGKGIADGMDGLTKYNTVGSYTHSADGGKTLCVSVQGI